MHKDSQPLHIGTEVLVPVWSDQEDPSCIRQDHCLYRICSVVRHHGSSPQAGHYTAYLSTREGGLR